MPKNIKCDVAIVGAGPAGLAAAVYTARKQLKTVIFGMAVGGQLNWTNEIENYPGFDFVTGPELTLKMKTQAEKWGVEFVNKEVIKITRTKSDFTLLVSGQKYSAKAVILAFGLAPKKLGAIGEDKFQGRGVTYCATCDGPLYKGKTVAVIGGGNSALEAADYLAELAKKVYLINIDDAFRGDAVLLNALRDNKNVGFYCFADTVKIKGTSKVESIIIRDINNSEKKEELKVDGIFVEIGYESRSGWLGDLVELNQAGEIKVNRDQETSVKGIFGAGDCTDTRYKQIVISAGEGAKAALQAHKYIIAKGNGQIMHDWGKCELVASNKNIDIKIKSHEEIVFNK